MSVSDILNFCDISGWTKSDVQRQLTRQVFQVTGENHEEFIRKYAVLEPKKKRGIDGQILPKRKIVGNDGKVRLVYEYELDVDGKTKIMVPKVDADNNIIFKRNTPGVSTPYYR